MAFAHKKFIYRGKKVCIQICTYCYCCSTR